MITDVTHRDLPASGRGCFAAVVIVPIAAFAGLMAITSLLTGNEDQETGPPLGLPHPTRVSQTAPLETEESEDLPPGTLAAQPRPLALHNPDKPTTTVTVPSTVVAASSAKALEPTTSTPCPVRTTPAPTTTTTTTLPPTSTKPVVTTTTTVAPPTTTTVATTTTTTTSTTSTSNTGVPK
jgi:hypothetical protein